MEEDASPADMRPIIEYIVKNLKELQWSSTNPYLSIFWLDEIDRIKFNQQKHFWQRYFINKFFY